MAGLLSTLKNMEISKLYNITLIEGDGIGPEISNAVVKILEAAGVEINWDVHIAGERAIEKYGETLPEALLNSIKENKIALTLLKRDLAIPKKCYIVFFLVFIYLLTQQDHY